VKFHLVGAVPLLLGLVAPILQAYHPALRPVLPAGVWAMQAAVPAGSNPSIQTTENVVPVAVPSGIIGGAAVTGELAPGVPMPGGARPNSAPVGADGRMPGLPPGVPLGPPAPTPNPAGGGVVNPGPGPTAAPGGGSAPVNRISPADVSRSPAAVPKRIVCEAQLGLARTDLPSSGGEFTISIALRPPSCRPPVAFAASWIHLVDAPSFRFAAEPNTSNSVREVMISIGDSGFFVRQQPPAQPGLAAVPSRLVFGIDKRGKTDTKQITGWTEYGSGMIQARAGHPWLSVTPRRSGKDKRQGYDVTVRREAALGPGRHDSYIDLVPEGSAPALRIPVVVEVPGVF
jgi:hypothetical protein